MFKSALKFNCVINASLFFLMGSGLALATNALGFNYPGNNYFPPHTLLIEASLLLIYAGFYLQFGASNKTTRVAREILFLFMVMAVLVVATNAVQFTPFAPIDKHLIASESWLPIHLVALMNWTYSHPFIKHILETIYLSLTHQMTYLPLLVIILGRTACIREYYFLLLVTALLGYGFYYFFPTTAPASLINSPHFSDIQHATGLKFNQIHQHIKPTTLEGGMIAFPSFHVIWAWLCVYLVRQWRLVFVLLLPINLTLVASCVMLGWHYPIDVLGSILVILAGHGLYALCQAHHLTRAARISSSTPFNNAANRQPAFASRSSTRGTAIRG